MKLLLVTSRFPFGPKEAFLVEEIAQLSKQFDVVVLPALPTREPLAVAQLEPNAIRMRLLSPSVLRSALGEFLHHPVAAARAFATVVRAPCSLHAKVKNALIFPTALAAARIARAERVDHVHGYWLTTPSTIAYVVAQLRGIPWSATGHRYDLVDFNLKSIGTPNAGFMRDARFIRCISRQGAQRVMSALGATSPVRVIHLGVMVPPAPRVLPPRTELHLLCAANLEPVKGHDILLQALSRAIGRARVRVTFAGDGTLRRALETRAADLGLCESARFEGVVAHDRLLERMASGEFDGAILTSLDEGPSQREGIPVFLMEAMANGLPVIATRSGAVTELADDGNALLCEPGDVDALSGAIVSLAQDGALRQRLATSARARIETDFEAASCAQALAAQIVAERADRLVTLRGMEIPA